MYPKHRCCTPYLKDIKRSEYSRASKGKKRFFRGLAASKENCCSWHRGVPLLQERPHIKEDHWTKQPFQTGRWRLERERIRRSESKSKRKDREQDKLEKEGRETPRFSKRHIQKRYPRHLKQSTCKILTYRFSGIKKNTLIDPSQYLDLSWPFGPGLEREMPQKCENQPKAGCRSLNRDFERTCTLT